MSIPLDNHNLVVLTLILKNESDKIKDVLEYYINAGLRNFSIIDCISSDNTISICNDVFATLDNINGKITQYIFTGSFADLNNFALNKTFELFRHIPFILFVDDIDKAIMGIIGLVNFCSKHLLSGYLCYYIGKFKEESMEAHLFKSRDDMNYYLGRIHPLIMGISRYTCKIKNSYICEWDEIGG